MKKTLLTILSLASLFQSFPHNALAADCDSGPTVPSNLVATAISSSQIDLSWTASVDNTAVTGYDIYRDNTFLVSISPATAYSNTGLSLSTLYSYKIRAFDGCGNQGAFSSTQSATTLAGSSSYSFIQTSGTITVMSGTVIIN